MALTAAERRKRYIDKMKTNGKFDEFKKENAEKAKKRRTDIKAGLEKLPKNVRTKNQRLKREYTRRKVAECRQRKKHGLSDTTTTSSVPITGGQSEDGSYNTSSALSKAVCKIRKSMPKTIPKTKQAVGKYLKSLDQAVLNDILLEIGTVKTKTSKPLSSSDIELVESFYVRDDISRMSPNVKDCRNFVDPSTGAKEYKQLRFLMYKLADVYDLFEKHLREGHDEKVPPVRFSKFCDLRPKHVKLVGNTPYDQCCCLYHSNFILCCTAIHGVIPEFPKYGKALECLILCRDPGEKCWLRQCPKCPNVQNLLKKTMKGSGKNESVLVSLKQWTKDEETQRLRQVVERGPLKNLLAHFNKILPEFLKHSFIKRNQAESFEKDNEEVRRLNGKVATLQVDFAESYTCEAQDEVQSAHWNQAATSLFTSYLKLFECPCPAVIASDNTKHTKDEIGCYLYKTLSKLPNETEILKVWSDGPNNQFKNRYIAAILKLFEEKFKIQIFWNFFATSHGKGCVDGLGAVAKKRVKRLVKSRKAIVNCAKSFVDAFNSESSVIDLIFMSEIEAKKIHNNLNLDDVFSFAPPVPNVFNYHQLQVRNGKIVGFSTSKEGYA